MDLVICNTPLQILQIESLINKGIIKEHNFHLIFFIYNETDKLQYYYNRLKKRSFSSFLLNRQETPFFFLTLRYKYKGNVFDNIFTASVDHKIVHYLLSFVNYNKLFTIDDGVANIWTESSYYKQKKKTIKNIVHYLLGCRFDLVKTKGDIYKHYTIYKSSQNITDKLEYNDLFLNRNEKKKIDNKEINIFVGTVYSEATYDKDKLIKKLSAYFNTRKFFYITHPRDDVHYFDNIDYINDDRVSEEIIFELLNEYTMINLYGFGSSLQYNMMSVCGVNNFQIKTELLKFNFEIPGYELNIVDIDACK